MGRVTARRKASHVTADDAVRRRPETLAVEEPLEIRVNGTAITVTMRTPGSDVELAQGFLLTEGVIGHRDDIASVAVLPRAPAKTAIEHLQRARRDAGRRRPDARRRRHPQLLHHVVVRGVRQGLHRRHPTISRHSPGDDPIDGRLRDAVGDAGPTSRRAEGLRQHRRAARRGAVRRRRHDAGGPRGHRAAQRRRQGHRLGVGERPHPADRNRPSGQRARVVRADPEGSDGGHSGAGGGVGAVVARRRPRRRRPASRWSPSCAATR